ncbi:MAG: hypothetical protein QM800_02700 [Paludibacter sp.]
MKNIIAASFNKIHCKIMFEIIIILFATLVLSISMLIYFIRKETDKIRNTHLTKGFGDISQFSTNTKSLEKEISALTLKLRIILAALVLLIGLGLLFM